MIEVKVYFNNRADYFIEYTLNESTFLHLLDVTNKNIIFPASVNFPFAFVNGKTLISTISAPYEFFNFHKDDIGDGLKVSKAQELLKELSLIIPEFFL